MSKLYSEEHLIFQESVRRFAEKELLPNIDAWEEARDYPSDIFKKMGDQGFLGILVPEEFGGVGGDYILAGAWCEEFGRVPSVGFTVGVNMHSLVVSAALAKLGTKEAKEKFLEKAVAGEAIGAYAFTEPGAGSDLSRITTTAVKDGDDYILNGAKTFITNGARADFILVLTKTDPDAGYKGFTTFVVDTKAPGFNVSRKLSKLGWHASDTAELSFEDVRVPANMRLGEINTGWHSAMSSLNWERMMLTLTALGGARKCLEDTLTYIGDRKVFGRSISGFDYTKETIARYWSKLEASEAYCHKILADLIAGKDSVRESALAKYFVCTMAIEAADACLQLHGGYGYTTEFSPERWLRDLRLNTIGGGTNEIMLTIAAKSLSVC